MPAAPALRPASDPAVGPDALDAVLRQIADQGFIQFHPALADRLGHKAALFMGHALYWSRHLARTQPKRGGWFFMTANQWQQATGLTAREQTAVRALLIEQGLLRERVAGRPAKLYFRVDLTQMAQWAGLDADEDGITSITWEAFSPWLRDCVSFYRPLINAAGSVSAALYLSYLLQLHRQSARLGQTADGFFPVSQEDVRIALCLGIKTQRNARDKLKSRGLLHERHGLACVDLPALAIALGQSSLTQRPPESAPQPLPEPRSEHQAAAKPDEPLSRWSGLPSDETVALALPAGDRARRAQLPLIADSDGEAQSTDAAIVATVRWFAPQADLARQRQAGSADAPKPACQPFALLSKLGPQVALLSKLTCPFVETNLPFCRTHIQKESINTTTTTRAREDSAAPSSNKKASRRRISESSDPARQEPTASAPAAAKPRRSERQLGELVLPKALASDWHQAVLRTVAAAPKGIRQALLDELQGQLAIAGKTIANPPGYLHALIRRHAKGDLVLAMADQVATTRRERQKVEAAVHQAINGQVSTPAQAVPTPTADSPAALQARQQLVELRKQFAAGGRR